MSRADKYETLRKLIQAFSEPYEGTVYHYTSADGISGIIWKSPVTSYPPGEVEVYE
jgi:hypothetical protein